MNRDKAVPRWPVDLEASVAKNVRRLRQGRGLSQQQLGSDLASHGFGMHFTTVAQVEVGARPLRLNEVAALAALFQVPIESLWEERVETSDEDESAVRDERLSTAQADDAEQMNADAEQKTADYYTRERRERLRDK